MKTYYKGASAALIVYDITREESFLNLQNEQKLISTIYSMKEEFIKGDIITMIVGNKIDLEEKRVVSKQRGLEYAESKRIAFYEVSAKEGTNINLIFTRVAECTIVQIQNCRKQLLKQQTLRITQQIQINSLKKAQLLVKRKRKLLF